jgi:PhzF family phenazine biosynthesis protein
MKLDLYQIDTFTNKIFEGNPACVVPLKNWLENDLLLKITKENAVAETAFFVMNDDKIHLRWFTPEIEMDLCGHATLATAYVLKNILKYPKDTIVFSTLSGDLHVSFKNDLITFDFPSRKPEVTELPQVIKDSLNIQPKQVLKARDFVLVYDSEEEIKNITINRQLFDTINLDPGGVIVTAKGSKCDFVSRFFTPQASILEDPVTGSAHCSLIPYWSEQLNKKEMKAIQLSERQGALICTDKGERVLISGTAKTYSIGSFWIN